MAAQNERPLSVNQALARLDVLGSSAAREIIGRGQIRVFAIRSDIPGSTTPEPVEELLAKATRTDVSGDEIRVLYDAGQDVQSILGPRSNVRNEHVTAWLYRGAACTVNLHSASIYRSELVEALAAGIPVRGRRSVSGRIAKPQRAVKDRRHGPEPGSTGFATEDEALIPEIDRLRKEKRLRSASAAVRLLDEQKKVAGGGGAKHRVERVVKRYWKWKKTHPAG